MKRLLFVLLSFIVLSATQANTAQETTTEMVKTELTKLEKDSIMFSKLNSEQILELKKKELDVEMERIAANKSTSDMPLNGFGIVMICLLPFLFVISIVFITARQKNIESQRKYDLYMTSLEMGQVIPEYVFEEPKRSSKTSNLQRGIILIMVGLSFGLFVLIKNNISLPFLLAAIIPTFVGIGYLIIHFLEKPKQEITEHKNEQV